MKEGSVVSDKVFVQFAHRSDVIQSEGNFEFVVSFKLYKSLCATKHKTSINV